MVRRAAPGPRRRSEIIGHPPTITVTSTTPNAPATVRQFVSGPIPLRSPSWRPTLAERSGSPLATVRQSHSAGRNLHGETARIKSVTSILLVFQFLDPVALIGFDLAR
jgi:hypothetical protein